MGVERALILPHFNDREMTRPIDLLEQLEANAAVLPAARAAITGLAAAISVRDG